MGYSSNKCQTLICWAGECKAVLLLDGMQDVRMGEEIQGRFTDRTPLVPGGESEGNVSLLSVLARGTGRRLFKVILKIVNGEENQGLYRNYLT